MEKEFTCIIAARYQSSRFPGKSLHEIHGKPMVLWVAEHAEKASLVKESVVATDDERIYNVVTEAGFKAMYTSEDCPNGSARVAEAAEKLEDEWVFEMQGDQPMVTPDVIDDFIQRSVAEVEKNSDVEVVIPFAEATAEHTASPDVLKVVVTSSNRLVFQTRQPIETGYRTLGLYLWNREALLRFASQSVSHIEKAEDSHPIRLYVNDAYVQGIEIKDTSWVEVDRPYQIEEVEKLMKEKGIV
ncbi:NTP transferase domain-containing protein [Candidatus Pacebacteria bacterium]|nr:NTP transferase domain-containing protein [Candidatus Paceibacterota bacterium]